MLRYGAIRCGWCGEVRLMRCGAVQLVLCGAGVLLCGVVLCCGVLFGECGECGVVRWGGVR